MIQLVYDTQPGVSLNLNLCLQGWPEQSGNADAELLSISLGGGVHCKHEAKGSDVGREVYGCCSAVSRIGRHGSI